MTCREASPRHREDKFFNDALKPNENGNDVSLITDANYALSGMMNFGKAVQLVLDQEAEKTTAESKTILINALTALPAPPPQDAAVAEQVEPLRLFAPTLEGDASFAVSTAADLAESALNVGGTAGQLEFLQSQEMYYQAASGYQVYQN